MENGTSVVSRVAGAAPRVRLGEELPIFCEKCGYQLHGLPQVRCPHCEILQFHCPECGHHQPINILRPAFQRILGRMRAWVLALSVLVRINFFGWILFAWGMLAYGTSYSYNFSKGLGIAVPVLPGHYPNEAFLVTMPFAALFGLVSRFFLLRWRQAWKVGLIQGALVGLILLVGAKWRQIEEHVEISPYTRAFISWSSCAALSVMLGVLISWPLWLAMVHLFLPRRTAEALLDWQRSLSTKVSRLARE